MLAELYHPNIGLAARLREDRRRACILVLEFVDGFSLAALLKKRPGVATGQRGRHRRRRRARPRARARARHRPPRHQARQHPDQPARRREDLRLRHRAALARTSRWACRRLASKTWRRLAPLRTCRRSRSSARASTRGATSSRSASCSTSCVCGARPFERGDESDRRPSAHRIRRDPPIPLHRRAPDVPLALERIVMRAIEKLPADRFQTAEALAEQPRGARQRALGAARRRAGRARARARRPRSTARRHQRGRRPARARASLGATRDRGASRPRRLAVAGGIVAPDDGAPGGTARRARDPLELVPAVAWIPARAGHAMGRGVGRRATRRRHARSLAAFRCHPARTTSRWCTRTRPSRSAPSSSSRARPAPSTS